MDYFNAESKSLATKLIRINGLTAPSDKCFSNEAFTWSFFSTGNSITSSNTAEWKEMFFVKIAEPETRIETFLSFINWIYRRRETFIYI